MKDRFGMGSQSGGRARTVETIVAAKINPTTAEAYEIRPAA
jgi:hypothetical protein